MAKGKSPTGRKPVFCKNCTHKMEAKEYSPGLYECPKCGTTRRIAPPVTGPSKFKYRKVIG